MILRGSIRRAASSARLLFFCRPAKREKNIELILKGECPNINIAIDNQKGIYTAHLTIIKRFSEDHGFYSFYLGGLNLQKRAGRTHYAGGSFSGLPLLRLLPNLL
jgi:hypothetical protein